MVTIATVTGTMIVKGLSAGYGEEELFAGLDLVVAAGDVIGLVGANGAGKSTLLRTLAGLHGPRGGTIAVHPRTALVGYLPLEPERRPGETVAGYLGRRTGVTAAQVALDAAAGALAVGEPGADDAYTIALERWLDLGGADLEGRAGAVCADLGLGVALEHPMSGLSGGQAARAGLAALLLSRYDIFLLDEPSNDLDLDGLATLEAFVTGVRAGTVLVSHDREFLTRTVTGVLELDRPQQQIRHYGGGYESYLDEREISRRHARAEYEAYADTRSDLQARARTQRNWMDKGVRNARRKATDNDKIGRKLRAESTEQQAAKARQTQRLIERFDVVEEPRKEWQVRVGVAAAPRAGALVAAPRAPAVKPGGGTP